MSYRAIHVEVNVDSFIFGIDSIFDMWTTNLYTSFFKNISGKQRNQNQ